MPSFLFQENIILKWSAALMFMLLSALSGKKVRLLPNIIMISGIVFANLLSPVGRVIYSVSGFSITIGAILNGLRKSAVLIGMIYISRFAIKKGFRLPGKTGNLLSLVFFYFEKILEGEKFSKGNLIKKIDDRIISVQRSSSDFNTGNNGAVAEKTSCSGWIYLVTIVLLNWLLLLYPFILSLI